MVARPPHDPTDFLGCAEFYLRGRPPYSRELRAVLARECGLDGSGRLLDVGCGPGTLAVELAPMVAESVGLDPDAEMLAEAARHATSAGVTTTRWVQGLAEQLGDLDLGRFRLVTFGQSFHRTDREAVAEMVYDSLEPNGAIVLVAHEVSGRPEPVGPGLPKIPHAAIEAIIDRYLGVRRRNGQGYVVLHPDRWQDALGRTRFGRGREVFAPGRDDVIQDADGVLANYHSKSIAAPHLFGAELDRFDAEVRQLLAAHSATGWFWDWPGDTAIVIAQRAS